MTREQWKVFEREYTGRTVLNLDPESMEFRNNNNAVIHIPVAKESYKMR